MWLILKVSIAIIAFFVRLLGKSLGRTFADEKQVDGVTYFIKKLTNKQHVYATNLGIPFACRSIFKVTYESAWDTFFKQIGLADEIQTGDKLFDENFYLASDCSAFRAEIKHDAKSRDLILNLFAEGCEHISCDGTTLWMRFSRDRSEDNALAVKCADLFRQLSDLDRNWTGVFKDSFALKILLVEAIIWSLAAYAAGGFFEWIIFSEDTHLSSFLVIRQGLFFGVILAAILVSFVIFFMKGSSRGHRIIVESLLVLGLSLPIGGIQLVSDINMAMDKRETYLVQATVVNLYEQVHRGRRGRTHYTYHMHIEPLTVIPELDIPRHVKISHPTYSRLTRGGKVEIKIGPGYLKHPWYKSIDPF